MQERMGEGSHRAGLLSIVVPVFNPGQSLERLLDSLPDNERVEIIFVDDGSTDGTAEAAEAFGTPVRVIRQANRVQVRPATAAWRQRRVSSFTSSTVTTLPRPTCIRGSSTCWNAAALILPIPPGSK